MESEFLEALDAYMKKHRYTACILAPAFELRLVQKQSYGRHWS